MVVMSVVVVCPISFSLSSSSHSISSEQMNGKVNIINQKNQAKKREGGNKTRVRIKTNEGGKRKDPRRRKGITEAREQHSFSGRPPFVRLGFLEAQPLQ